MAVSSGVSTAEWSEQLRANGVDHELTATDLTINVALVALTDRLRVLFDEGGAVLQVDIAGYPIYPRLSGRLNSRLLGLPSRFAGWIVAKEFATLANGASNQTKTSFIRRLELVTPRLRELGIDVQEEDLLRPPVSRRRWDAIRAANILNRAYFREDELRRMLEGLLESLEAGGLLAVCRTDSDTLNHGSIWRLRSNGRLDLLARLGGGSEVEDLLRDRIAHRHCDRLDANLVERRCDTGVLDRAADSPLRQTADDATHRAVEQPQSRAVGQTPSRAVHRTPPRRTGRAP